MWGRIRRIINKKIKIMKRKEIKHLVSRDTKCLKCCAAISLAAAASGLYGLVFLNYLNPEATLDSNIGKIISFSLMISTTLMYIPVFCMYIWSLKYDIMLQEEERNLSPETAREEKKELGQNRILANILGTVIVILMTLLGVFIYNVTQNFTFSNSVLLIIGSTVVIIMLLAWHYAKIELFVQKLEEKYESG